MLFDPESRLYHKQYDLEYDVRGNGDTIHKADRMKLCQMKTQMGFDRQRNWLEEGKTGRLLILFVSLIISSYVRHIWKTTGLKKQFALTQDILDEMRSILCIEHNGRAKFITPFVGAPKESAKPLALTSLKVAELNTNPERSPRNDADALQRQRPSNLIVNYTKIC